MKTKLLDATFKTTVGALGLATALSAGWLGANAAKAILYQQQQQQVS
jgi:hypothetical protein